jgi:DNA-binding transcriptional MocR family regulator
MSETTEKKLKAALLRLKHGKPKIVSSDRKISIRSLAEEAGVSDSTIHNRYPSIASEVREIIDKTYKSKSDKKQKSLKIEKEKTKDLRKYIAELEEENRRLVSINATLMVENKQLKSETLSENIIQMR